MEGWGVMHTPVRRDLECSQAAHAKFSGCGLWTVAEFSWRRVFVQAKKRETKKQIGDRDCLLGQTQGADSVCVSVRVCIVSPDTSDLNTLPHTKSRHSQRSHPPNLVVCWSSSSKTCGRV